MIREAEDTDWKEIWEILGWYIDHSSANLSWSRPDLDSFITEQEQIAKDYPYLVSEIDGEILGFGYAHRYLAKDAYQFDAELTIYFLQGNHHGEVMKLYAQLESICEKMGVRRLIGCTTASNKESLAFQEKVGFEEYGLLKNAGFKAGIWHDVIWTQKQIAPFDDHPGMLKVLQDVLED